MSSRYQDGKEVHGMEPGEKAGHIQVAKLSLFSSVLPAMGPVNSFPEKPLSQFPLGSFYNCHLPSLAGSRLYLNDRDTIVATPLGSLVPHPLSGLQARCS